MRERMEKLERDRQTDRQTERQRETETERDRERACNRRRHRTREMRRERTRVSNRQRDKRNDRVKQRDREKGNFRHPPLCPHPPSSFICSSAAATASNHRSAAAPETGEHPTDRSKTEPGPAAEETARSISVCFQSAEKGNSSKLNCLDSEEDFITFGQLRNSQILCSSIVL